MDIQSFRELLSDEGKAALEVAAALEPVEENYLQDFVALGRRFPPELAQTALETAILRREASVKFPGADRMYFTREALEQASPYPVSTYRSQRYREFPLLADLGCSIGGDTLALAAMAPVVGIDLDPLRLSMASANLEAASLSGRAAFACADLNRPLPLSPSKDLALFFDPARRSEGRRIFSVHLYRPSLDIIRGWLDHHPSLGVKISPGVNLDEISGYDAEVEFISLQGELKEADLWFGPLKTGRRRATLLPGPHSLVESQEGGETLPLSEPLGYLYEPDPAILRAGLVGEVGRMLQAAQLDPSIAYLTGDRPVDTPFARGWPVEDWFPFQLKRLREYLRKRGVGRVTVKKRGSPLQPEALIQELRLRGNLEKTIFLTQLRGRPVVIVCPVVVG